MLTRFIYLFFGILGFPSAVQLWNVSLTATHVLQPPDIIALCRNCWILSIIWKPWYIHVIIHVPRSTNATSEGFSLAQRKFQWNLEAKRCLLRGHVKPERRPRKRQEQEPCSGKCDSNSEARMYEGSKSGPGCASSDEIVSLANRVKLREILPCCFCSLH